MVSVSDLKSAIEEKEEEIRLKFKNENIVERELISLVKGPRRDFATIITGPRRSGKSIFAFQLAKKEKFGYVNFEDERLRLPAEDLNKVLEALYALKGNLDLFVFDEIQNIDGWEPFISRLLGSKKIIITGSNSKIMSQELASRLTGRHLDYELFPFSFGEFLEFKAYKLTEHDINLTRERAKLTNLMEEYVMNGGFPLALREGRTVLSGLYKDIVEKDVTQRYKINMRTKIAELSRYLISNSSSEISYNKLKNVLGVRGQHTTQDWINYLEKAYLLFKVERFSFKLKEAIMAPKKIYAIDTGIINIISNEKSISRLVENVVAVDLLRKKAYSGIEINYWKNYAQKEVDFVLRRGSKVILLIQVTYASEMKDIKDREIDNLIAASSALHCNDLLVITWGYEAEERIKGKKIKFVPLWKWLLNL